jgi:hypothetical protein
LTHWEKILGIIFLSSKISNVYLLCPYKDAPIVLVQKILEEWRMSLEPWRLTLESWRSPGAVEAHPRGRVSLILEPWIILETCMLILALWRLTMET